MDRKNVAQKFTIQSYKIPPRPPADFEAFAMRTLQQAICSILGGTPCETSYEELYQLVLDVCDHKIQSRVYGNLVEQLEQHVVKIFSSLARSSSNPLEFLPNMHQAWTGFSARMHIIESIFVFLDRTYLNGSPVKSLRELGLSLFQRQLILHPVVEEKTLQALIALIDQERQGETVDETRLRDLICMFAAVQLYQKSFFPLILRSTYAFYSSEGKQAIQSLDISSYLQLVQRR